MAGRRTVVEILKPVMNEEGQYLDVENKPIEPDKKRKTIQEQQFSKELYYLLHWGLETNWTYDENKTPIPYSSTVGICQHIKTGVIETFIPGAMRVIGFENSDKR